MLIALVVGIPAGISLAVRRGSAHRYSFHDWFVDPAFDADLCLGLIVIWLFGVQLKWLPPGGRIGPDTVLHTVTGSSSSTALSHATLQPSSM